MSQLRAYVCVCVYQSACLNSVKTFGQEDKDWCAEDGYSPIAEFNYSTYT